MIKQDGDCLTNLVFGSNVSTSFYEYEGDFFMSFGDGLGERSHTSLYAEVQNEDML